MRKFIFSVLTLLYATTAMAVSLEEALTSGYNNDEELKAIRVDFLTEIEQFPSALSSFMPEISAQFQATETSTRRIGAQSGLDTITTDDSRYDKNITLRQQIFNGGSSVAGLKAAQAGFRASRSNYFAKEQDSILREIGIYLDCVATLEKFNISKISVKSNKTQLEAMREKFRLGESTDTEVATAETGLANAQANQSTAEANFETSKAEFSRVFAIEPGTVKMPEIASNLPHSLDDFIDRAIASNPNVIAATHSKTASKAGEYVKKGALLPQVSVAVSKGNTRYMAENQNRLAIDNNSTTATLTVNVPILARGGAEYSDIRRAKHQTRKSVIQLDSVTKQIKAQCKASWEAFSAAKNRIAATNQGVKSASIAYEGMIQEEMLGSKTIIDVLDSEDRLNAARQSNVDAKKELILASYRIKSLMGELTAQQLQLPVECFDPDKEFRKIKLKVVGY